MRIADSRRVLISIQQSIYGGPHNLWLRIGPHLEAAGWELVFVVPTREGTASQRLKGAGFQVVHFNGVRISMRRGLLGIVSRLGLILKDIVRFRRLIAAINPTIVVSCGLANIVTVFAAWAARTPILWEFHSVFAPGYARTAGAILARLFADSAAFVGETTARAHSVYQSLGGTAEVFYPPVDVARFRPVAVRTNRGLPTIGTLGNYNPHKGHDVLLDSSLRLWQEGFRFRLLIAGHASPSYSEEYEAMLADWMERAGLLFSKNVEFPTPLGDVDAYLRSLDIFALPSRTEGIPTSLLEAMACGLPCVATRVGGIHEVVTSGVNGLLVAADDAETLRYTLVELLERKDLCRRLGENARQTVVTRFSTLLAARRHAAILEAAVERHFGCESGSA